MVELVKTRLVRLEDVADVNPRLSEKIDPSSPVSFVGMADLSIAGAVTEAEVIRPYSEVAKGYTAFRNGDLLVAKITPCFENGKIGQARLSHRIGFGSTEFHVVRPHRELADGRFLLHFLRSPQFRASGEMRMTGSGGQRRVPADYVKKTELFLPPLDEQQRIAAVLDKADMLRAKRRQALAHLETLSQSIFENVFGDLRQSQKVTFDELCRGDFRNGVSPSTRGLVRQRVLTLSAVTGEAFDAGASKIGMFDRSTPIEQRVASSSLLICRGNGNLHLVGRGHFPPVDHPDIVFPDTIIAAKPDFSRVTRAFLGHVWNTPEIRSQLENRARTTNGTFKVNQSMLGAVLLPEPAMALQNAFSEKTAAIDRLRVSHCSQLEELDVLFASLQQRAFQWEL